MNTLKAFSAYSDFPPPAHFPNFMPNRKQHEYLKVYAKEFGLYKHICFNHWVTNVQRAVDYAETGRWVVSYKEEY
ncbi:Protein FMO-5 [Aphelenchoides avenae]|nr:Protein FMO-5 [Aphelenchus avenae]